ncbi:hypothetical protein F5146DRAFT_1005662 [Armillaria mellea]|nr:hypothetical protein F5146DRAFT_1005662 [Armillaria mellea]
MTLTLPNSLLFLFVLDLSHFMSGNLELPLSQFPEPPPPTRIERLAMQRARQLPPLPNYPPPAPPARRVTPRCLSPAVSQEEIIYCPYATPLETIITPTSNTVPTVLTTPLLPADTSVPAANTMEMLHAVSANATPPPEALGYFHDLLQNTLHRALTYTVPPTTTGIHQDHIESLAELYSIIASMETSLTFLFALSENIRARELQHMEQKKLQMKELDRSRLIVWKNVKDVIACIPHN